MLITFDPILGRLKQGATAEAGDSWTGGSIAGQAYSALPAAMTPPSTSQNIDWDLGNGQVLDLGAGTGDVTITTTNPYAGSTYFLKVIQHASGFRNLIFPANFKWAGATAMTTTQTAGAIDSIVLFYDGTNFLAGFNNGYV